MQEKIKDDMINRREVVNVIRASTSKYTGFMEMEMYTDDDAVEAIENLPSAQQWILASERLPEKDGMYYVTIKDGAGAVDAVPCLWYDKKWAIGGVEVIAWIAIPEPYKERQEE